MLSVVQTHTHTHSGLKRGDKSTAVATYVAADLLTCGAWLKTGNKSTTEELISTSESISLPKRQKSQTAEMPVHTHPICHSSVTCRWPLFLYLHFTSNHQSQRSIHSKAFRNSLVRPSDEVFWGIPFTGHLWVSFPIWVDQIFCLYVLYKAELTDFW